MDSLPYAPLDYSQYPDADGHFGVYGGRFVSETLMVRLTVLSNLTR